MPQLKKAETMVDKVEFHPKPTEFYVFPIILEKTGDLCIDVAGVLKSKIKIYIKKNKKGTKIYNLFVNSIFTTCSKKGFCY